GGFAVLAPGIIGREVTVTWVRRQRRFWAPRIITTNTCGWRWRRGRLGRPRLGRTPRAVTITPGRAHGWATFQSQRICEVHRIILHVGVEVGSFHHLSLFQRIPRKPTTD